MDEVRAGRILRAMRLRLRWSQKSLAARSGVSQQEISLFERGHMDRAPIRIVRAVFKSLDASAELDIRWRGGAMDRLLDDRHAALVATAGSVLSSAGWEVLPEVSYNVFGERGSIDLVAWHAPTRTLLVVEVKSKLTSLEATLRKHDEKVRLGPEVVAERFGWRPLKVARLLVLPDSRTVQRRVAGADTVLRRVYPVRGWAARRWLKAPIGRGDGLIYLPITTPRGRSRGSGG